MIKCLLLLRRAPHLSREEFAEYWKTRHSQLAVRNASVMRMRRYVQNHHRTHAAAEAFRESRNCLMADYDGVAEAWWDSFEDMIAAGGETPADIVNAILADERAFLDLERCVMWFGEEFVFVPTEA